MKIISLNIEGDRHIDSVSEFLLDQKPDILCLSEVFEEHVELFEKLLGMKGVFAHQCRRSLMTNQHSHEKLFGVALFSKDFNMETKVHYYVGDKYMIPSFKKPMDLSVERLPLCFPVIVGTIWLDDKKYNVASTHLAVTPNGIGTEYQKQDAKNLIKYLKRYPEIILCGDFNAPRNGEVFSYFTKIYKDNIPEYYQTSLDQKKHRVPGLQFMVDGMFSTTNYKIEGVKLIDGISDHMAIIGSIVS